jgi:Macrocin-O-methyltransferase (TylF)
MLDQLEIKQGGLSVDADVYLSLLKRCLTAYIYPESSNREVRPTSRIKQIPVRVLNKLGLKLVRAIPFDPEKRAIGSDWPGIVGYSMIGLKRLGNLQFCVETALEEGIPGDLLEAGVWRGGAAILMRAILKIWGVQDRVVWLADSFEGLPASTAPADLEVGDYSGVPFMAIPQTEVAAAFQRFELLDGQVKFLKGWFKDTLPTAPVSKLAVLRLDGDLYESTMDGLNGLYQKVSPGGFVIIDDYNDDYNRIQPCKQVVTEFRDKHRISDAIVKIDDDGVYWRKSS